MTEHFINGINISPNDIDSIGFSSNWSNSISLDDRDSRELALNTGSIILSNEGRKIVLNWFASFGTSQGIPYSIRFGTTTIEYYIDLTENFKVRDYSVTVSVKRRKSSHKFFEDARGTSFELLNNRGVVFNFVNVPYIIVPANQVEMGLTLSLSIFVMGQQAIQQLKKVLELTAELSASIQPIIGVSAAGPTLSVNIPKVIEIAIKLLLQIAYTVLLVIALIKLVQQLSDLIFPKVRNFLGCKVKELIEKGCANIGYTVQSSLLNSLNGLTILPVPLVKSKHKGLKSIYDFLQNDLNFAFTKGYPTAQDTVTTLWSLIEQIENIFNAETRVIDGVVRIEKKGFLSNNANSIVNASLVLQDTRQDEYSLNTFDTWKRYYIHYQPDYTDVNTLDNFDNTDLEYSTEPLNIQNADLVTIKGLQDRNVPFALGTRKNKLNLVEKTAKGLFALVDALANTSFASLIEDRKGVLVVSQQFFGTTKLLWTVNGKQPENFTDYISPTALWNNYHSSNQIQTNGYKIKESVKCLMNEELYVNLLNNNWVLIDGISTEIISIEYKTRDSYATISFRQEFNYELGKVETILING